MEVLTGIITRNHDDDAAPPPRSIFDPQPEDTDGDNDDDDDDHDTAGWDSSLADTLTTRDTRGTYESARTTTTLSPRYHNKHPSSLNEVELRIQLWDAYRLARIILGTPIKSFSLRGKTILQSIQKVAEMKLELIRLQTELQLWNQTTMVVVGGGDSSTTLISPAPTKKNYPHPPQYRTLESSDTTETPKKANRHRSVISTSSLVDQLAMLPPPPAQPVSSSTTTTPAAVAIVSPDKDDQYDDSSTKRATSTTTTPMLLSSHSTTTATNMKGIQQQYEQLQETQDQTLQEFYTQLQTIKNHIIMEQLLDDELQVVTTSTTTKSMTLPHEPQEDNDDEVLLSHKSSSSSCGPAGGLFRRLRRKKSRGGGRTQQASTTTKAQDTLQAVAAVAKEHDIQTQSKEELQLRTELYKPLRASIPKHYRKPSTKHEHPPSSSPTTAIIAEERKKLLQMIQDLMKKVEISSQETQLQFNALSKQLEAHSQGSTTTAYTTPNNLKDANVHTPAQFQQRLQTVRTLHTLELATCQSKHRQQISDLAGQLEAYQHQVKKQNSQLMKWRQKYNRLEELLVTPEEAQEVLTELQDLSFNDNDDDDEQEEEKALVKAKVLHILQRMTQLQNKQVKEEKLRNQTRQLAQAKEASSQSELEDLRLQHQLLKEDTEVSPEEWEKQLGKQRRAFEREMKEVFRREEQRLREMEVLEVQLTDLAFLAVEVEDLEQTCRETNEHYAQILAKAQQRLATTNPMIKALQAKTQQVRLSQRDVLQDLETAWASTTRDEELPPQLVTTLQTKLRKHDDANEKSTEWLLARRNEELKSTQAQLAERDSRIQDLEKQIREMQGVAAS